VIDHLVTSSAALWRSPTRVFAREFPPAELALRSVRHDRAVGQEIVQQTVRMGGRPEGSRGGAVVLVVVLVIAVLLNATGTAAAGMALWRDTRAVAAGPRGAGQSRPRRTASWSRVENTGALLLNLVLFILNVWRLAAAK
jgi:hypothetical protein